jgi:hypothetical protein
MRTSDIYEVEKIIGKREKPTLQYKVKWKGWSERNATWEPLDHLMGVSYYIEEFEKSKSEMTNHKIIKKNNNISPNILSSDDNIPKVQKYFIKTKIEEPSNYESKVDSLMAEYTKKKIENIESKSNEKIGSASKKYKDKSNKRVEKSRTFSKNKDNNFNEENKFDMEIRKFLDKCEIPEMIVDARKEAYNKIALKVNTTDGLCLWVFSEVIGKSYPKLLLNFYEKHIKF